MDKLETIIKYWKERQEGYAPRQPALEEWAIADTLHYLRELGKIKGGTK